MTFRSARLAFCLGVTAGAAALLWSAAPALADGSWSVAPTTLDFGTVTAAPLGQVTLTFTLTNPDPKYYVLFDIEQAGAPSRVVEVSRNPGNSTPDCATMVGASATCTQKVYFRPSEPGHYSFTFVIKGGLQQPGGLIYTTHTVTVKGVAVAAGTTTTKAPGPKPPPAPKTEAKEKRITTLRLLFDERIADEKHRLRAEIHDADLTKTAIEARMREQWVRLSDAIGEQEATLAAKAEVEAGLVATKKQLEAIAAEELTVPTAVRPLAARRDKLAAEVARLNGLVLGGNDGLLPQLASTQAQLDRAQQQLDAKLPARTGLAADRAKLVAELDRLDQRLLALSKQELRANTERELAEKAVSRAVTRRAELDAELTGAAQKLAALDFSLNDVEVEADGKVVYDAQLNTPFKELEDLNAEIASGHAALTRLNSLREHVTDAFLSAQDATIASRTRLAAAIMDVAEKKAAIDFAYNAYDVIKAGFKGGLVGAVTETGKKVVETLVSTYVIPSPSGIEAGSIEAEFNDRYDAKLKESISKPNLTKVGVERVLKETLSKAGKDALNQRLGPLIFVKVYGTVPAIYGEAGGRIATQTQGVVLRLVREQLARQEEAAIQKKLAQLIELQKGVNLKSLSLSKLGAGLLKDATKVLAKAAVDTIERDAWYDYFAADVNARATFPLWQLVTEDYWDEFEAYQELLLKKQKLLQGYDPGSGMRVVIDSKFSESAALKVVLEVVEGEKPVTLHVVLSDREATPVGGYKYTLAAKGLPAAVTVEVR